MNALSLYIHIPWCIRKCPYCDFNSHKSPDLLPETQYVHALIQDLQADLALFPARPIQSIFIGGGTPSLLSAEAFFLLFEQLRRLLPFGQDIEITMEANPGTVEQQRFSAYRQAGINRLSLGIQSFHSPHLKTLGRIHDGNQARLAIETARLAGFDNLNLDIMHSLPNQTVSQGLEDLKIALSFKPEHLSWYQLTIEPNTVFYKQKPALPSEDDHFTLEDEGLQFLESQGLSRYEISAFARPQKQALHNLNYWLYGDYYGIGAGAHGKYSGSKGILRTRKHRQPKDYLNPEKPFLAQQEEILGKEIVFEFMLNTSRLEQPIPNSLFQEKTGLTFDYLQPGLEQAHNKGLLVLGEHYWQITKLGRRFTNNLQELFLP